MENGRVVSIDNEFCGHVAHLGEHEHGMFGVAGSIPVMSTISLSDYRCPESLQEFKTFLKDVRKKQNIENNIRKALS